MSARTKTGYDAWREQNLRLPFPSEFRTMPDGGIKVIWEDVIRDWWELEYGYFTWNADGTPVGGHIDENFHDPDYCSRDFSLTTERDLAQALAQYV